jgi:tetratricopeptide (TPR) repeat protein
MVIPENLKVSFLLYRAHCLRLLGLKDKALLVIEEGISKAVDIPELLKWKCALIASGNSEMERELRIRLWDQRGRILPLSFEGTFRDARSSGTEALIERPLRFEVPVEEWDSLFDVAELLDQMNLNRPAVDTYLDLLYSRAAPWRSIKYFGNTCEYMRGFVWLRIARLEKSMGNAELAFRAYLRAAYYDKSFIDDVATGIAECLSGKIRKTEPPAPQLDLKKIKSICALYRKMNMHPYALAFINKVQKLSSVDLSKERKKTEDEWNEIVNFYLRCEGPKRTLFGIEIGKVDDWSKVKILRPSDTFWKPYKASKKRSQLPGQEGGGKITEGEVPSPGQISPGRSESTIPKGKPTAQFIAILAVSLVAIGGAALLLVLYLRKRGKEHRN